MVHGDVLHVWLRPIWVIEPVGRDRRRAAEEYRLAIGSRASRRVLTRRVKAFAAATVADIRRSAASTPASSSSCGAAGAAAAGTCADCWARRQAPCGAERKGQGHASTPGAFDITLRSNALTRLPTCPSREPPPVTSTARHSLTSTARLFQVVVIVMRRLHGLHCVPRGGPQSRARPAGSGSARPRRRGSADRGRHRRSAPAAGSRRRPGPRSRRGRRPPPDISRSAAAMAADAATMVRSGGRGTAKRYPNPANRLRRTAPSVTAWKPAARPAPCCRLPAAPGRARNSSDRILTRRHIAALREMDTDSALREVLAGYTPAREPTVRPPSGPRRRPARALVAAAGWSDWPGAGEQRRPQPETRERAPPAQGGHVVVLKAPGSAAACVPYGRATPGRPTHLGRRPSAASGQGIRPPSRR
jgi:hypothetical protein